MKKIISRKIPDVRKSKNSYSYQPARKFVPDSHSERDLLEFEFAHFSAAAVMRKTIEVIV